MAKEPDPIRITTASRSHREDIARRQKRYLISMGVRTACFVAAIVSIGHWFVWIFLVGSFVLPYIAVVMANAGAEPDPGGPEPFVGDNSAPALEESPERKI
jgi:Protein of unknown function (DUF3099)